MKKIYHKFPAAAILLQILIIENELTKFRVPSVLRQNIVSNGVKLDKKYKIWYCAYFLLSQNPFPHPSPLFPKYSSLRFLFYDIISAEEKEAAAKPTFTFPASFIDASPTACVARIKRT